jgi:trimeric autotransporter adhesin
MTGIFSANRAARTAASATTAVTAAACALLLAGCASATVDPGAAPGAASSSAAAASTSHAQTAAQDADSLFAAFPAPPGATRLTAAPAAVPLLAGVAPVEHPADPNLVQHTEWWTTSQAPAALLAWIKAHPPTGTTADGSSTSTSSGATDLWIQDFAAPAQPGVISQRLLEAAVTAAPGGGSALRVDAIVTYLPTKSAAETIAVPVTLEVTPDFPQGQQGISNAAVAPLKVTDPVQIAEITSLVNGLPAAPAGGMNCPMDNGSGLKVSFQSASGAPWAQADINASGCRTVTVTVNGKAQPALSGGDQLTAQIISILGTHWQLTSG